MLALSGLCLALIGFRYRSFSGFESAGIELSPRDKRLAGLGLIFFLMGFGILLLTIARDPMSVVGR
jgi:hypothetical protein